MTQLLFGWNQSFTLICACINHCLAISSLCRYNKKTMPYEHWTCDGDLCCGLDLFVCYPHVDPHWSTEFRGCGHAPDVPGTSMAFDGHYQGAVVRYTCKDDYTVCHQRNTSVCQASGQWETVADICGKFRWRNPVPMIFYTTISIINEALMSQCISLLITETDVCIWRRWWNRCIIFTAPHLEINTVYVKNSTLLIGYAAV